MELFCKYRKAVHYLRKKVPPQMFDRALNTPLQISHTNAVFLRLPTLNLLQWRGMYMPEGHTLACRPTNDNLLFKERILYPPDKNPIVWSNYGSFNNKKSLSRSMKIYDNTTKKINIFYKTEWKILDWLNYRIRCCEKPHKHQRWRALSQL